MDCKKLHILYVEDEEDIREAVHSLLSRRFEHVYVAKNGKEGLKLFKEYQPNVVITDIVMPEMDGISMIEQIKKTKEEMPPVIIVTAYKANEYHCDLASEHIFKPYNPSELVESILEHSRCQKLI